MRSARRVCAGLFATILLAAIQGVAAEHPLLDSSSNCVDCHSDKLSGSFVHPPVASGCDSCHKATTQGDKTRLTLVVQLSSLCFRCHKETVYARRHFPYAGGMCTRCHDPHVARESKFLRADVNTLCLRCHLAGEGPIRPGSPLIHLNEAKTMGHPYAKHPVAGKSDPLRHRDLDCTSCHMPHGGSKGKLLRTGVEMQGDLLNKTIEARDICAACHDVLQLDAAEQPVRAKTTGKKRHHQ